MNISSFFFDTYRTSVVLYSNSSDFPTVLDPSFLNNHFCLFSKEQVVSWLSW